VSVSDSAGGLDSQPSAPVEVHNWFVNLIISLPYLGLLALGVLLLVTLLFPGLFVSEGDQPPPSDLPDRMLTMAWLTLSAVLFVRAVTRGVVATPDGLRVRRVFRTRRIAWGDIDRFRVRVDAHPDQMTWYSCVVDGSGWQTERDLPLASGDEAKAAGFVRRLNQALAEHKPTRGTSP
jgi:hypothetical protein